MLKGGAITSPVKLSWLWVSLHKLVDRGSPRSATSTHKKISSIPKFTSGLLG